MDGLSIAGSVAGLVSLGIQVTQTLADFYSAYKDQNSDIAYALRKLSNLAGVLESLREQTSRTFHVDEKRLLSSIEDSMNGCELLIKELQHETEIRKNRRHPSRCSHGCLPSDISLPTKHTAQARGKHRRDRRSPIASTSSTRAETKQLRPRPH
ncbi:hypothetical protein V2G26_001957 [Clonostachys chloroleuca]